MPKKNVTEEIPDLPDEKQQEVLRSLPEGLPDLGPVVAAEQQEPSLLQQPSMLALLAGFGAVVAAVLWAVYPTLRPDEQTPVLVFGVVAAVLAALCAALAAVMAARPFYSRGTHWVFCRDGLVRVRWGRWADVFEWAYLEVRKVSSNPAVRRYEVAAPGREPVRLTCGLIGGRLIRKIQDMQVRSVLPALRDAVAGGEEVPFGPLWVSREGLRHRKKVLPWGDTAPLEFAADFRDGWAVTLTVRSLAGREWATVKVDQFVRRTCRTPGCSTNWSPRWSRGWGARARQTANLRGWLA
jgi:hypothetical protein